MANINLISQRRADRVRQTKVARSLLGGSVGVLAVGLGCVLYMGAQIFGTGVAISSANEELKKLQPVLLEIQAAERDRAALLPKLVTLTDAQNRTKRWLEITEGLKRAIPEQTWLTSLSVESTPEGPRGIRLNGITENQSRVGETMYRLNCQPEFYKRVDLRFTQTTQARGANNVEFELNAQLADLAALKSIAPRPGEVKPGEAKPGEVQPTEVKPTGDGNAPKAQ